MERNVGVAAAEPGEQWGHETAERNHRIATEGAEEQIEPNYVRLQLPDGLQQPKYSQRIVERPATDDVESVTFNVTLRKIVRQDCQVEKWILL
jgi:hypothetical protein